MQGSFAVVWSMIVGIGRGAFNTLSGIIESGVNGVIGALNVLLSGVSTVAGALSALTGGAISLTVGRISPISLPRLAVGADVLPTFGGTAVILGEGGRRESVVDYGKMNGLLDANALLARQVQSFQGGVGMQNEFNINVGQEDPRVIARMLARELGRLT